MQSPFYNNKMTVSHSWDVYTQYLFETCSGCCFVVVIGIAVRFSFRVMMKGHCQETLQAMLLYHGAFHTAMLVAHLCHCNIRSSLVQISCMCYFQPILVSFQSHATFLKRCSFTSLNVSPVDNVFFCLLTSPSWLFFARAKKKQSKAKRCIWTSHNFEYFLLLLSSI